METKRSRWIRDLFRSIKMTELSNSFSLGSEREEDFKDDSGIWLAQLDEHRIFKANQMWWKKGKRSEIMGSVLGMLSVRWFYNM